MSVAGIDIGDAASCIALARKGGVDVLLNKESKRETPSVVTFTHKQRMLGTDAVGAMSTSPLNTLYQIKRLLGKDFNDPAVQKDITNLPYKVSAAPDGKCLFEVEYLGKPAQFRAEQLMAGLLVDLKTTAEKEQGAPVTDAVVSVPVYYTEAERHAMLTSIQIAGLNCLRLLDETTATALAYGIYKTDLPDDKPVNVAFVDVGYSSTQVCVVALKRGQLQVLANAWDRDLGGRDFDEALFKHFEKEFCERYKVTLDAPRSRLRLRLACERVKKILTTNPESPITVESLTPDIDANGMVTRDTFEELSADALNRLLVPVEKAVKDAGLTPEQIDNIEVVGGSTRVPAVLRLLSGYFGKEPSRTLNSKETPSRGCALQCAMLSPAFKVREFQVLDAFPYGVQFSWDRDGEKVTSVVFERGSHVPSAKMLTFYRDGPFEISAEYTPDSDIPSGATRSIGTWKIGPFAVPDGLEKVKLKVKVMLNLNGVVSVDHVNVIEEEEAPAATEEAPKEGDDAAAAADTAMPDAAAADNAEAAKKKKTRTKKTPVPFTGVTAELPKEQVQRLFEAECEVALQARIQEETNDAKNAVESYIYSLRNSLSDALAAYARDEVRSEISSKLDAAEDWLYDEGEDQVKSVYIAKLEELKKLGGPIEARAAEDTSRPAAVSALRSAAQNYLTAATGGDARFVHIEAEELQKVADECQKALAWLSEKEAAQGAMNKYDDPVLLTADIAKKHDMLQRFCEPILSKPVPKPEAPPKPAAEEPKAEEEPAAAEGMEVEEPEVGPQPAAEDDAAMQE